MIVRPAILPIPQHTRSPILQAESNLVRSSSPSTVFLAKAASSHLITSFNDKRYIHFHYPLLSGALFDLYAQLRLDATGSPDSDAFSGLFKLTALSTDWDPTLATYINQPATQMDDPSINWYIEKGWSGTAITEDISQRCWRSWDVPGRAIYGIKMEALDYGPYSGHISVVNFTLAIEGITTKSPQSIAVASRASSGTTRTLVTTDPHGLETGYFVMVHGVGDNYDSQPYPKAVILGETEENYPITVTKVNATTITYAAQASLTEATTACGGNLLIY